jgi:hypothetical protein
MRPHVWSFNRGISPMVLVGLVAGAAAALLSLRSTGASEAVLDGNRPFERVSLCVRPMTQPWTVSDVFSGALETASRTEIGQLANLSAVPKSVDEGCAAEPPFEPSAGEVPTLSRKSFVSEKGSYDLYVYVYPQSVVDKLGSRWDQRIYPQEMLVEGSTAMQITSAVFIGDVEVKDSALVARLVERGLGLAGAGTAARATIDNTCTEPPDSAACGGDVFAPAK